MDNEENNETENSFASIGSFVWDLVKVFVIAFVAVWLVLRPFVAEPFIVSGLSMFPNFHDRDYLVVQKISYRLHPPERGDVIVFRYPKDPSQYFIKRIMGLPGETVRIEQSHVIIINKDHPEGFTVNEPFLPPGTITLGSPQPTKLGSSEYFAMGDNRTQSSDSRVWGVLPKDDIVGKVWVRVLPLSKMGFIEHPKLNP